MNELALFAGAGGGILGGQLLGWRTVAAVEWEAYAAGVLIARQNDGLLPPFPIWDDVQTFDGRPFRGRIDVVSGGFPCQDISVAGKGVGIVGERSGMWKHMARIVGEVRPRFVFVENSPALVNRGLGTVLGDLAALGYDCRWTVLGAADVGAPHQRDRFWLVAYARGERYELADEALRAGRHASELGGEVADTDQGAGGRYADRGTECPHDVADAYGVRELQPQGCQRNEWGRAGDGCPDVADTTSQRQPQQRKRGHTSNSAANCCWRASDAHDDRNWWATEPDVGRVANGLAARVDRLKAIGNGQVPQCAAAAWRMLTKLRQVLAAEKETA